MTFASTRFLLTAQALEALHRRLYPDETNTRASEAIAAALAIVEPAHRDVLRPLLADAHEPTFRQRLKRLRDDVSPALSEVVGPRLRDAVDAIVENRNAVTHWDSSMDEPDGLLLTALRLVGNAVFDLVVLARLDGADGLGPAAAALSAHNVRYWLERALETST